MSEDNVVSQVLHSRSMRACTMRSSEAAPSLSVCLIGISLPFCRTFANWVLGLMISTSKSPSCNGLAPVEARGPIGRLTSKQLLLTFFQTESEELGRLQDMLSTSDFLLAQIYYEKAIACDSSSSFLATLKKQIDRGLSKNNSSTFQFTKVWPNAEIL